MDDLLNLTGEDRPHVAAVVTGPGLDQGPEDAVTVAEEDDLEAGPTAVLTVGAGATVEAAAEVLPTERIAADLGPSRVPEVLETKRKTAIELIRTLLVPVGVSNQMLS